MSAPAVRPGRALPVGGRRGRRAPAGPRVPLPRPAAARIALLVVGAGLGATTALTFTTETAGQLRTPGGPATFAGSLTGMTGTYLALMMVLLVSRIPVIERVLGQDGLLRWHRRLAPWPISLLVAHAVFITVGYAQAARTGLWHEAGVLLTRYPYVLIATVGLGIMCLIGVISIRAIRGRLSRETWWLVHLYMYLALALSFAHVIVLGPSFVGHPLTRAVCYHWPGPPRRGWCWPTASACRSCAACATAWWWPRCGRRARAWCRSSARGGGWMSCRWPAGSSCCGAFSPGAAGGRPTPTPCRPSRSLPTCASPSKRWAITRPPSPRCGRGRRSWWRGPTGRSPATRRCARGPCWWPRGSGSPPCARCWRTCPARARRSSCCGSAARRTW